MGVASASGPKRRKARVWPSTSIFPPDWWNASRSAAIVSRVIGPLAATLRVANRWLVLEGVKAGGVVVPGLGLLARGTGAIAGTA